MPPRRAAPRERGKPLVSGRRGRSAGLRRPVCGRSPPLGLQLLRTCQQLRSCPPLPSHHRRVRAVERAEQLRAQSEARVVRSP